MSEEQLAARIKEIIVETLALEDVVSLGQRPKVEPYENHLFVVAKMPCPSGEEETEQLSLFLGEGFLLTFQERPGDWQKYYHGDDRAMWLQRHFSLSDRIRYYWPTETAETAACGRKLGGLTGVDRLEIRPGAEHWALLPLGVGRQDSDPDIGIVLHPIDGRLEALGDIAVHGVAGLGSVQGDGRDATLTGVLDDLAHP